MIFYTRAILFILAVQFDFKIFMYLFIHHGLEEDFSTASTLTSSSATTPKGSSVPTTIPARTDIATMTTNLTSGIFHLSTKFLPIKDSHSYVRYIFLKFYLKVGFKGKKGVR